MKGVIKFLGDYMLEFTPPHVNYYQNASNVIALLEGESGLLPDGSTATALLVNCHYDSVPYAVGESSSLSGFLCFLVSLLSSCFLHYTSFVILSSASFHLTQSSLPPSWTLFAITPLASISAN